MQNKFSFDHNRSNTIVLIAPTILCLVLLVLTITFGVLYGQEKAKSPIIPETVDDVCVTPYCVKAANYLIESIDESVSPCENFFEFACGTWLKKNRIPDDAGSQDTFNLLRNELDNNIVDILTQPVPDELNNIASIKNARLLYQSCVDEGYLENNSVQALLSFVNNELGGWPILQGSSWNQSSFNLSKLLLKLREYNHNLIFSFGTSIDDRNSSAYYIRISQSDLGLEQRSNYLSETKLTQAYKDFIRDMAKRLVENRPIDENDVQDIYNFEKTISAFHWTPAEQRARQNETVRTVLRNISDVIPTNFDFKNYLQQTYLLSNVTLNDNDILSISEIEFLRNASRIIDNASPRTIQNYFLWRFVMNRLGSLPRSYRLIREPFDRIFRGTSVERPRPIVCGSYVNGNMGFALSKIYIKQYFDENARKESLEMIANIRNSFISMVTNSSWMDKESKQRAIEKALAIDEKIGYPDYLGSSNTSELDRIYEKYIFDSSYLNNTLQLLKIKAFENLKLLRDLVDRKEWGSTPPTIVNAFYNAARNQIIFPAGILQTPFFHKDAPKYLNYGGIGAVIGHEITHGFDDNGRQFDKDGNRIPWWTSSTIEEFNRRKKCIVDQYSSYIVKQINLTVNGNQTQGENIADNGGIKEAFYAYVKWWKANSNLDKKLPGLPKYTQEQLFFINYAQVWCSKMTDANAMSRVLTGVHSPGEFRVIGPTSNFDEFHRVFKCTPGQNNNRIGNCSVW